MVKEKVCWVLLLAGLLVLGACHNPKGKAGNKNQDTTVTQPTTDGDAPVMTFTETVHDFGKLVQGEIVKYTFHFKNTGKADLRISRVSTSCGCTVGKYPHHPIKPGGEGDIEVTFNSTYKEGYQDKSIMILANTDPARTVLRIKAVVELPKNR